MEYKYTYKHFVDFIHTECKLYWAKTDSIDGIAKHYDSEDILEIYVRNIYLTNRNLLKSVYNVYNDKKDKEPVISITGILCLNDFKIN